MNTTLTMQDVRLEPDKKEEPRLPRHALLDVLADRAIVDEFQSVRPYTYIRLHSWYNGKEYIGIGFSKVCYPDKWDPQIGAGIATKHALIMILHQVRADELAHSRMRAYDNLLADDFPF